MLGTAFVLVFPAQAGSRLQPLPILMYVCYPAGRYDDAVIAAVQQAGYLGATTTRYGLARPTELYTLARVRVNGSDGVRGFAAKLEALPR
jgi:hypothetical protein